MYKDTIKEIIKDAWNNKSHESFGEFLDESADRITALLYNIQKYATYYNIEITTKACE